VASSLSLLNREQDAFALGNEDNVKLMILDRDLKIIQVNDNFLKLVDMERENLLGQRIEDISLSVFDTTEIMSNLEAALNGKQIK
jgi:transcriptional regulator with PAS, ATPase and Fis domain